MNMGHIRVGTRGSALALWQARWVIRRLRRLFPGTVVEERIIKTQGDLDLTSPLGAIGGKGLFTNALDEAILKNEIDLAVHSMKDYPTDIPEGIDIVACPSRVDPKDALITKGGAKLTDLPNGATVGTGSLRRIAQLRAWRPDLKFADIRGNLDTRLKRLDEGNMDAIVLAVAGLKRLGLGGRITQQIPFHIMTPAVGQGALAVTGRADKKFLWKGLNDLAVEFSTTAERALLSSLGGGCHVPIGAIARFRGRDRLFMQAVVADSEGGPVLRACLGGPALMPEALGWRVADALMAQGAGKILGIG